MSIKDIPNTAWRNELLPATFGRAEFHCDVSSWQGGRRIVEHQFPKKDLPYAEDMGRTAVEFSIRGYCVAYPLDIEIGSGLWQRDYRRPRDLLQSQLDAGGPAILQLPTMSPMYVVCSRYRLVEERRLGGYCAFDMTFVEAGIPLPAREPVDPKLNVINKTILARERIVKMMSTVPSEHRGPRRVTA
jgi:prophage DNA circulation protein